MPQAADSIGSAVEQLNQRLRDLERRVSALEGHQQESTADAPRAAGNALQEPRAPAKFGGFPSVKTPTGAATVLGKAVLGIAGAYLLRSVAESGAIPKLPVLIAAIVYASLWMIWAVRTHATSRFASVTYGITSALILSPLLWESTVRFQVLPPIFAAVELVAFAVLALALAWPRNLQVIPSVATLVTIITALALMIATHDLVPLTSALLAVALAIEVAACLGLRLTMRPVSAIAANFAVWLLVDVMTSSEGVVEGYHPTRPTPLVLLCLALLVIYGGSIGIRTFWLRQRITLLEIAQGVAACVLAAFGALRATHGSAAPALGVLFLLLAAACYWGALLRFAEETQTRNRRFCASVAAALLLAGSFLLFPTNLQVPFLSLAAVAAAFVYTRTGNLSLGMHACSCLVAAAAVSPLPNYAGNALAGTMPAAPVWGVWIVPVSAGLCYAIGSQRAQDTRRRLLWIVPAALAAFAGAALAVVAIVFLASGHLGLDASLLSVIPTAVTCSLALILGFLGVRWKRVELGWVAYAAVAFGTLKLLLEDLWLGNAASLMVSLLFYGLILILLPRLTRWRGSKS